MTTDIRVTKSYSSSLTAPNDIFALNPQLVTTSVAAVSFIATKPFDVPWASVVEIAFLAFLQDQSFGKTTDMLAVFFGVTAAESSSVVAMRHKFWGTMPLDSASAILQKGPSVSVTNGQRLHFTSVAILDLSKAIPIVDLCRNTRKGLLLLFAEDVELNEMLVRECYAHCFDLQNEEIDWNSAVAHFCPRGVILIRVSGAFDDPDGAIDLIFDPTIVSLT